MSTFGPLLPFGQIEFGAADAETEATLEGGRFLSEVFHDPFNAIEKLKSGRFVVTGKKGTGKSEFVFNLVARNDPNQFVKILRFKNFEISAIAEELSEPKTDPSQQALWKWIMLCSILSMLSEDHSIELDSDTRHHLGLAIKRIQGFTSIDGWQVQEAARKTQGKIEISPFKSLAKGVRSSSFETRETRSSIFEMIPQFENLILDITQTNRDRENMFLLCIDDLDEDYSGTESQRSNLRNLLKVSKEYHTKFNFHGLRFIPIILIRHDILEPLNLGDANLHKAISNNTQKFNWFAYAESIDDRPDIQPLWSVLTERIRWSYLKHKKDGPTDLIDSLFSSSGSGEKSVFKYILDGTLYRPRDLILLFNSLKEAHPTHTSVSRDEYQRVYRKKYATEKIREWEAELKASIGDDAIRACTLALRSLSQDNSFKFEKFKEQLGKFGGQAEQISESAYAAGMIANVIDVQGNKHYNWSFRTDDEDAKLLLDSPMMVHRIIREKFKSVWRH